jgi:putative tryptophan/tyrosine transport system substrate-binding protein
MLRREFITLLGSTAIGWSISAPGAQGKIPRVAVLVFGYPDPSIFETGFRNGLRDLGYEQGRSIELIVRSAEGKLTALTSLAAELIGLHVDIIVAYPTTAGIAVHQQTSEIPVVVYGGDLEATKLVAGLARPGGNVTGVSGATAELATKNLELIVEILPAVRRVAVLVNADSLFGVALLERVQAAAEVRNIEIKSLAIRETDRLDADFASLEAWKPDALLIHPALPQKQNAGLALNRRLPAVSPTSAFCEAGGLASYSADIGALAGQCATFVDKILKGRKPSDLPVELPTRFLLRVNLKTARAIGLSLPPTLLGRADEVIE